MPVMRDVVPMIFLAPCSRCERDLNAGVDDSDVTARGGEQHNRRFQSFASTAPYSSICQWTLINRKNLLNSL